MYTPQLQRLLGWGLMIVMSIAIPPRLTAHPMQDLGSLLPPGNQAPPTSPQDPPGPLQQPGTESTLDSDVLLIEDRFAGWQQAGTGEKAERLGDQLRAHWVMVDDNGLLTGRVLADRAALTSRPETADLQVPRGMQGMGWQTVSPHGASGQNVSYYRNPENPTADRTPMQVFLLNRGTLISMTAIDADGRFHFRGVKPGSYSLVGYGRAGFFAFGLNILKHVENATVPKEVLASPVRMYGLPITSWVQRAAPTVRFRVRGQHRFGEGRDDPPRLFGMKGLQTFLPDAIPATSISGQPTALTDDGRLLGRLHYIISFDGRPADVQTTTVQLTQNNRVVGETTTDNYGVFEFRNIAPGKYGVLAVGPDGMAALDVTVAAQAGAGSSPVDIALLDDTSTGFLNHFMIETAYWAALSPPLPEQGQNQNCGCDDGFGQSGYGAQGLGLDCPLLDWMHQ